MQIKYGFWKGGTSWHGWACKGTTDAGGTSGIWWHRKKILRGGFGQIGIRTDANGKKSEFSKNKLILLLVTIKLV